MRERPLPEGENPRKAQFRKDGVYMRYVVGHPDSENLRDAGWDRTMWRAFQGLIGQGRTMQTLGQYRAVVDPSVRRPDIGSTPEAILDLAFPGKIPDTTEEAAEKRRDEEKRVLDKQRNRIK
jgi:hypothetical protein